MPNYTTAETNLRTLSYVAETNWAVIPATPTMLLLRTTGDTLAYTKKQEQSKEIRADRQIPSVIEVGDTSEGQVKIELSLTTFDQLIEGVLGGT